MKVKIEEFLVAFPLKAPTFQLQVPSLKGNVTVGWFSDVFAIMES